MFESLPGLCGDVVNRLESEIEQIELICTSGARGFVALDVAYALRSVIELFVVVSESARTDDVDLCSLFTVVG